MAVRISAVIPTYNRARLLMRALESVFGQSRQPDEIIVVDDGSTDETRDYVVRWGKEVRYLQQENAGGAAARNRGVREARGEWIAFLDSDDVWLSDHLRSVEEAIAETGGRAVCYFADIENPPHSRHPTRFALAGFQPESPFEFAADGTAWAMIEYQPMMLQASVISRDAFQAIGGLWEELRTAHDTHLFLKLGIGRPLCALAACGARQTSDDVQGSRLTTRQGPVRAGRMHNRVTLCKDILARFPSLAFSHRQVLRRRIASARWALARTALKEGDLVRGGLIGGLAIAGALRDLVRRPLGTHR